MFNGLFGQLLKHAPTKEPFEECTILHPLSLIVVAARTDGAHQAQPLYHIETTTLN